MVATSRAHRRLDQDAAELGHRLDEERAGHHWMAREMIGEDVVGERDALDRRRDLGRLERQDPIEQEVSHRGGDYTPATTCNAAH